jgi:hypothetical protein
MYKFEQKYRVVLWELPEFEKVCMNYQFKNVEKGEKEIIIFCKE